MNDLARPLDTELLEFQNSIRKRQSSKMKANVERQQLSRCLFSLHKTPIDSVATAAVTVDFCHKPAQNRTVSLFTLNLTPPPSERFTF